MREGLQLDPNASNLVDIYRLPQHPIFNKGEKVDRPEIIKLSDVFEKKRILDSLSNLKFYNQMRKGKDENKTYVYVSEHLPTAFQKQKTSLLPKCKEAKKQKKKTFWKAVDGEYCLFIDNVKHLPFE